MLAHHVSALERKGVRHPIHRTEISQIFAQSRSGPLVSTAHSYLKTYKACSIFSSSNNLSMAHSAMAAVALEDTRGRQALSLLGLLLGAVSPN